MKKNNDFNAIYGDDIFREIHKGDLQRKKKKEQDKIIDDIWAKCMVGETVDDSISERWRCLEHRYANYRWDHQSVENDLIRQQYFMLRELIVCNRKLAFAYKVSISMVIISVANFLWIVFG